MPKYPPHEPYDFENEYIKNEFGDGDFDDDGDIEDFDDDADNATLPCPYCGLDIYEDAEVCPECGSYVAMEPIRRSRPEWIVWTAIVILAAFLFSLLGFLRFYTVAR